MTDRNLAARLTAFIVAVVALAGCNATDERSHNPYRADFEAALDRATSDFEREVLGDYEITRAEYEEAVNRYVQCGVDQGVDIRTIPQGGYFTFQIRAATEDDPYTDDGLDEILDECRRGTTKLIEPLYVDMAMNPNRDDIREITVACFRDKGLARAEYTAEEFGAEMRSAGEEQREPVFPFDSEDPRFDECMANPSQR